VVGIIVPTSLESDHTTGIINYLATISIGSPHKRVKLRIDFTEENLVLFSAVGDKSTSLAMIDNDTNDVVMLGDKKYRFSIEVNSSKAISTCEACDGILGLSSGSVIWKLFPDISFTPHSMTLGKLNPMFKRRKHSDFGVVSCVTDELGMCRLQGIIDLQTYDIILSSSDYSYFPESLFNSYFTGKNIHFDTVSKWHPLKIRIRAFSSLTEELSDHLKGLTINFTDSLEFVNLELRGEYMTSTSESRYPKLLVKSHDFDYIILGASILNSFIVHRDTINEMAVIRNYPVKIHYSVYNLVILMVLLWIYIRWKTTEFSAFKKITDKRRSVAWDCLYQFIAIPIIISIYLLPQTFSALRDYFDYYLATGIVLFIELLIVVWTVYYSGINLKKIKKLERADFALMRNTVFELLLLNGMCLILLEKRVEFLGNFLTLCAVSVVLYLVFYYVIIVIVLFATNQIPLSLRFIVYSSFVLPGLAGYHIYFSFKYFIYPMAIYYTTQFLDGISILIIILYYAILLSMASYIVKMDIFQQTQKLK
jgi:hypothetical protein